MFKDMVCTSVLILAAATAAFAEMPRERLTSLKLPNATITSALAVPKGPFLPLGLPADATQNPKLQTPAYCRVAVLLTPSSDSHIEVELWMPARENWNVKYQAVGGGGWVGSFNFNGMLDALQQGYATSSTDTGHKGPEAAFAVGHPEKLVDFAYRAVHEMSVTSKTIMMAFYGRAPRLAYVYSFLNSPARVDMKNGRLVLRLNGDADIPLFAESTSSFFVRTTGTSVRFERDSAGATTAMVIASPGGTPVTCPRM
jgi:Tannase and feruloyl esterase